MMDGKDTVEPKVLFTDWEVVSILPAMWDFMYLTVLGMTIEVQSHPWHSYASLILLQNI